MSFILFSLYFGTTWLAIVILYKIEIHRVWNHLRKHHRQKWEELGPETASLLVLSRLMAFLYSSDNLGDPIVEELKLNYRRFMRIIATVIFTAPSVFILMLPWGKMLLSGS